MTGRIIGMIAIFTLAGLVSAGAVIVLLAVESERDSAEATTVVLAESLARSLASPESLSDQDIESLLETERSAAQLSGVWLFDTQGRLAARAVARPEVQTSVAEGVLGREEILAARQALRGSEVIVGREGAGVYSGTAPIFDSSGELAGAVRIELSLDGVGTALELYRWQYILGVIGLLILVLILAWFLAKRLARPLGLMVRAARSVEAGRAPEPSVTASLRGISLTRDEYGTLAGVFIDMAQEVGAREVRLNALVEERTQEISEKNRALESAQKVLQEDLNMAHAVQAALVPQDFPEDPRVSVSASMTPAREVGGDFYDAFMLDDGRLAFAIADVSGKGVASALLMAVGRALLRSAANEFPDPSAAVAEANNQLCSMNPKELFITAFFGVIDLNLGTLTYVNAGHDPPYMMNGTDQPTELTHTGGIALGVLPGLPYSELTIPIDAGTSLFMFTDGITEAQNTGGELFGKERLENLLITTRAEAPETMIGSILGDLGQFTVNAQQFDDITCIAVRYEGGGATDDLDAVATDTMSQQATGWRRMNVEPVLETALQRIQAFVERFAAAEGWDVEHLYRLNLGLDELLSNTLQHGFPGREAEAEISVALRREGEWAICRYEDNGEPFNPWEAPKSDPSEGIEEREIGGWGLQLIEATLDDVSYAREKDRNVTTLRQRRGSRETS